MSLNKKSRRKKSERKQRMMMSELGQVANFIITI